MSNVAQIRANVHKALDKIGNTNGTRLPQGANNQTDPLLHRLLIIREVEAWARKQGEAIKAEVKADFAAGIEDVAVTSKEIVHKGKLFALFVDKRAGRSTKSISRKKLLENGVKMDVIEACVETSVTKPSVSLSTIDAM